MSHPTSGPVNAVPPDPGDRVSDSPSTLGEGVCEPPPPTLSDGLTDSEGLTDSDGLTDSEGDTLSEGLTDPEGEGLSLSQFVRSVVPSVEK
jgi:hypothetical protein